MVIFGSALSGHFVPGFGRGTPREFGLRGSFEVNNSKASSMALAIEGASITNLARHCGVQRISFSNLRSGLMSLPALPSCHAGFEQVVRFVDFFLEKWAPSPFELGRGQGF